MNTLTHWESDKIDTNNERLNCYDNYLSLSNMQKAGIGMVAAMLIGQCPSIGSNNTGLINHDFTKGQTSTYIDKTGSIYGSTSSDIEVRSVDFLDKPIVIEKINENYIAGIEYFTATGSDQAEAIAKLKNEMIYMLSYYSNNEKDLSKDDIKDRDFLTKHFRV